MSPTHGPDPSPGDTVTTPLSSGDRIAILGDEDGSIASAIIGASGAPTADLHDVAAVVALGRDALLEAVRDGPVAPILPVGVDLGVQAVQRDSIDRAVTALFADTFSTVSHPISGVVWSAGRRRALADITLLVGQPGRLSEFSVCSGGSEIGRVRADGVVVALLAGSQGYAQAAGGPVVGPESAVATVIPVAPYAVDPDHWILLLENLELSIEREGTPVDLIVDGETTATAVGGPVALDQVDTFRTIEPPAGCSMRGGLETP